MSRPTGSAGSGGSAASKSPLAQLRHGTLLENIFQHWGHAPADPGGHRRGATNQPNPTRGGQAGGDDNVPSNGLNGKRGNRAGCEGGNNAVEQRRDAACQTVTLSFAMLGWVYPNIMCSSG